jgi:uncharacterized protein (DUF433 family)
MLQTYLPIPVAEGVHSHQAVCRWLPGFVKSVDFANIPPIVVYLSAEHSMAELFTLDEAAAIAEIAPDTVRTALEKRAVIPSRKVKTGKAVRYRFSEGDVLFLLVLIEFPFPLSREEKDSLAQVLAHGSKTAKHWVSHGADVVFRSGDMKILIECKPFRETVEKNVAAYRWGKERITSSPDVLGGEPVFRGTRVPLEHVAALFRKRVPETEIADDFPALDERDLAYARLAARFGAPPGRPKKRLRFEREQGARR